MHGVQLRAAMICIPPRAIRIKCTPVLMYRKALHTEKNTLTITSNYDGNEKWKSFLDAFNFRRKSEVVVVAATGSFFDNVQEYLLIHFVSILCIYSNNTFQKVGNTSKKSC